MSYALFKAASLDQILDLLSWQAVDGKGYFAADVKLRLPTGERLEPDLIVADESSVWLIEIKALHSEALSDEVKLARIPAELGVGPTLRLLSLHSGFDVTNRILRLAIAYDLDDLGTSCGCSPTIAHLEWRECSAYAASDGLAAVLRSL